MAARPEQPEPFLRGCAWPAGAGVPYPRADPRDVARLPADTWATAQIPATVRLEFVGDATEVEVGYRTMTDDLGYRGDGAGRTFSLWQDGMPVSQAAAGLGEGAVRLAVAPGRPAVVYLPEGMKPLVLSIRGCDGTIAPAPEQPRWLAYGDSLAEGWVASQPALAWPAIAGREHGLDVVNLGYAGSARGELVSAEHISALPSPEVISVTHGTNCWTRIPHSAPMMAAAIAGFLEIVRQGHPEVPVVVASPVVRPDAEQTPNRLGATLADLRRAMEEATQARIDAGDGHLRLVPGGAVLPADQLADGIHPGDDGHRTLARVFGNAVAAAARGALESSR
jgi:lysophospholipase L1-like esterase